MKILLVNTFDRGGAANSCKRLHLALLNGGVHSKVLLKHKQNNWPESYEFDQIEPKFSLKHKIKRKIRSLAQELKKFKPGKVIDHNAELLQSRPKGLEMFSFPETPYDITNSPLYNEGDIINLHWVANFMDYESFFKKNSKPVVWTLHDMSPFTGGEHYEEEFYGISDSGLPLKRKYSEEELSVINKNVEYKKKAVSLVENLTLVAPSKWLAEKARKSEIFKGRPVYHLPYGLDQDLFYPKDKFSSRKKFNIPGEKKVILFVSDSIQNNRKGFIFLKKAIEQLNRTDLVLCAVGSNADRSVNKHMVDLGEIKDEKEMSSAYSAADVFVIPSLMDNLPNTVLESLMCGTPVLGFPVGGIPEMIQEGINGMLTKEISVSSLSKTINLFLDSIESFDRKQIRKDAVEKYGLQVQANNYIRLFQEILKDEKLK
ncbi:Glycosyltransferase involved in cell wall bisynthesis [Salinimicrobium sediminis]|uniref:Glycosyltransferase involved in cell wall bisynthesis n=1 Tax=Salinimicrobium sediminis TaxID=1343891 RepID=A0A285WZS6_9FLAO|nr:glycosyltransferase [Salinimicrobium sediminis]SOC78572.1 Glycosyltransferase involved in cell wall bisynthesis [Salinimicrobium sediminis]